MKLVIQIKKELKGKNIYSIWNTDTEMYCQKIPKHIDISDVEEGLYIMNIGNKVTLKRIDVGRIRDENGRENIKLSIYNKSDYEEICQILGVDVVTFSNRKDWIGFSLKFPVKKFYELGTDPNIAYEVIEFECTPEEADKYKLNLLEYKDGVAKAYRYKFSFYYMMNSNKNMSLYKLDNYTKDVNVYCEFNPQCNIIFRNQDGKIIDGQYITI